MFKRFSLPEQFAILGAILFVLVGSLLTYLDYRTAVERMEALARNTNTVASRTLWNHIRDVALPLLEHGRRPMVRGAQALLIDEIDRQASDILHNTDIDKIVIFGTNGHVLYSTDPTQIGKDESANPRFMAARDGEEVTKAETFDTIVTINGVQFNRVMNATYMPIYETGEELRPIGVFEIYTDITEMQNSNRTRAWIRLTMLFGGLTILYALLVMLVTHSHRQIRRAESDRVEALSEVMKVRAEEASKSTFLAHMSHELHTPLNAIIGFSEFIQQARELNLNHDKIAEYAGDIGTSAVHLLRIINDLLDLTRLDLGRMKAETDDVNLSDVFKEALSMVSAQSVKGKVRLLTDFPTDIPRVECDRQRIKKILVNLLSNAVKFTPVGGTVSATITITPDGKEFSSWLPIPVLA